MSPLVRVRRAVSAAIPYRRAAATPKAQPPLASPASANLDLIVVLLVLWIVSAGRVWLSVARGEPAGAEITLAGLSACLLPILFVRDLAARWLARR